MTTENSNVFDTVKDAFAPMTDALKNFQNLEVPEAARDFVKRTANTAKERAADVYAGSEKVTAAIETAATDAAAIGEAAVATFAPVEASSVRADADLIGQAAIGQVEPADAPSINPGAPVDNRSIGIETIANAYTNYANKSWRETGSFVERLMRTRSLDRAIEVQTEFARKTCTDVVVESLHICDLYGRLVQQAFKSWQGFAPGARRK